MNTASARQRIVVVGGGFAGLNFVKHIDKKRYEVIIIDRNNFHSFPPLFYQVASSGLDPASISFPFRREMSKKRARGVRYHMGDVRSIDLAMHTVITQFETLTYDKLVIAAGTTNNFFGNTDLSKKVFTLKSTSEALRLRNEILGRLERASICADQQTRRKLLSFVVIGGGPSGVEVAGAIGEMKRYIISREYPGISADDVSVTIVEGSDRLLRSMSRQASEQALAALGSLMVDVKLNTLMDSYDDGTVSLHDGTTLHSDVVVWTAGITGEPLPVSGGDISRGPGGRILTDICNRVKGQQDVFAIGDIAYCESEDYPHGFPQLAQVAIQQGRHLARQLNGGRVVDPFVYTDRGSMATIGRNRAVADLGHLHLHGFTAWLAWMFIHLISLLGMRNKLTVLINWIWAYFTYNASLRLIIRASRYPEELSDSQDADFVNHT